MSYTVNTDYRKDRRYPAGHGYGRQVNGAWVAFRPGTIQRVIIHATHGHPGTADTAEASYLCTSPDVSAHGLIGRDGTWYEILPELCQAWHSGDCTPNDFENPTSIGIELHAAASEPITNAQKATLAARLLQLRRDYGIGAPDVRSHRSVAAPPGRKSDPGTWSDTDLNAWVANLFATDLRPDPRPGALSPYTEFSPILAAPLGDQAGFVKAIHDRCTGTTLYSLDARAEIANAYWLICGAVGVDPWLAAAQMCHETGNLSSFFAARPRRNSAGLGVTGARVSRAEYNAAPAKYPDSAWVWSDDGQWRIEGIAFPTWAQHSVPAHVGRLLAYAVLPDRQTPMQAALVSYALKVRSLPTKYWGVAPKLAGLRGTWAFPGVSYPQKIAEIANAIRQA